MAQLKHREHQRSPEIGDVLRCHVERGEIPGAVALVARGDTVQATAGPARAGRRGDREQVQDLACSTIEA
jgi:hypothetical protein